MLRFLGIQYLYVFGLSVSQFLRLTKESLSHHQRPSAVPKKAQLSSCKVRAVYSFRAYLPAGTSLTNSTYLNQINFKYKLKRNQKLRHLVCAHYRESARISRYHSQYPCSSRSRLAPFRLPAKKELKHMIIKVRLPLLVL